MTDSVDVVVVGAGAAGIGVGAALSHLDVDFVVIERGEIGESFRGWPDEMRFITPSYPSNAFGFPDLNAIVPNTSPAVAFDAQQLSGTMYAEYLEAVAESREMTVETGVTVTDIRPTAESAVAMDGGSVTRVDERSTGARRSADRPQNGFVVETSDGPVRCAFVVWATGEFPSPRTNVFPGADLCVHNSTIDAWNTHASETDSDEFIVIGGFESGIDAAINLAETDCSVTVLDRGHPWALRHPDPSETLSPHTLQRLEAVRESDRLRLIGGAVVNGVDAADDGRFEVCVRPAERDVPNGGRHAHSDRSSGQSASGEEWQEYTEDRFRVSARPILATGFDPTAGIPEELFPIEDGSIRLSDRDESPDTPGLFLAGPAVAHAGQAFCFIYKFRSRFPVIAETIGDRLGVDTDALGIYRNSDMFLDDLSCCDPIDCDC